MKSQAPRRIASTARSKLLHAVITITACGVAVRLPGWPAGPCPPARGGVARVVEVHQDQIEDLGAHGGEQRFRRIHGNGLPPLPFQQQPQRFQHVRLIVADQHPEGLSAFRTAALSHSVMDMIITTFAEHVWCRLKCHRIQ